jgi:hypothetical protein
MKAGTTKKQTLDVHQLESVLESKIDVEFFEEDFDPLPAVINVLGAGLVVGEEGSQKQQQLLQQEAYQRLQDQKETIDDAVNQIVSNYHADFNNSVRNFSTIYEKFSETQTQVNQLRRRVRDCKGTLNHKKDSLNTAANNKTVYTKLVGMLEEIEALKETPSRIDQCIQNHRFLEAVHHLKRALASMFSEDLCEVQALSFLRHELMERKQVVEDKIVDELHTYLYLSIEEEDGDSDVESDIHGRPRPAGSSISGHSFGGGGNKLSSSRSYRSGPRSVSGASSVSGRSAGIGSGFGGYEYASSPHGSTFRSTASRSVSSRRRRGGLRGGAVVLGSRAQQREARLKLLKEPVTLEMETQCADPRTNTELFARLIVQALESLDPERTISAMQAIREGMEAEVQAVLKSKFAVAATTAAYTNSANISSAASARSWGGSTQQQGGARQQNAAAGGASFAPLPLTSLTVDSRPLLRFMNGTIFPAFARILQKHQYLLELLAARQQDSSRAPPYSITDVWRCVQRVLRRFLQKYFGPASDSLSPEKSKSDHEQYGQGAGVGSFLLGADADVPGHQGTSRGSGGGIGGGGGTYAAQLCPAHPYHIVALYRPLMRFHEFVAKIIRASTTGLPPSAAAAAGDDSSGGDGGGDKDGEQEWKQFLDGVVDESLVPLVTAETNVLVEEILHRQDAFHVAALRGRGSRGETKGGARKQRNSWTRKAFGGMGVGVGADGGERDEPNGAAQGRGGQGREDGGGESEEGRERTMALRAFREMDELLHERFRLVLALPNHAMQLVTVIQDALMSFYDHCDTKFRRLTQDCAAFDRLERQHAEYGALLRADPAYLLSKGRSPIPDRGKELTGAHGESLASPKARKQQTVEAAEEAEAAAEEAEEAQAEIENKLEAALYELPVEPNLLKADQLVFVNDQRQGQRQSDGYENPGARLALIGAMAHSLDWLAQQVYQLRDGSGSSSGGGSSSASTPAASPSASPSRSMAKARARARGARAPPNEAIFSVLFALANRLSVLADQCLFFTRTECRLHCFHFLAPLHAEALLLSKGKTPPLPPGAKLEQVRACACATRCSEDLLSVEQALAGNVTAAKSEYIFGGLGRLVPALMMHSLKFLRGKKAHGDSVERMSRSALMLMQTLGTLRTRSEFHAAGGTGTGATEAGSGVGGREMYNSSVAEPQPHSSHRHFDRVLRYVRPVC